MARSNFENLRVYQLAEHLADRTWETVITWDAFSKRHLGSQLVEAVDSIAYLKSIGPRTTDDSLCSTDG
jgi:hypothetical protein